MKVSLAWLKRYVRIEESAAALAHDLTMFGVNVEAIEALTPTFKGVVYGKVLDVRRHPGADRLSLCTVDAGGAQPLSVVCGAPNVKAGMKVPVAVAGAVLAGGLTIKKSKIRGQVSEGMLCSEIELGIGDDHSGIMSLDFDEKPGVSLEGRLGENDYVFDVEVTPNRPDLLCHVGIAREVAALYRRELTLPEGLPLAVGEEFKLRIENGDDCPRYVAAFIDDVVVGPSPPWMQKLLKSVGLNAINTIVDATNFVLMELGQPLHAFDRDTLARDTVVVRRARKGEKLITLDGVERELDPGVLVIADDERPIGIAGVMGGRASEVTERTKRILLESAMFDPRLIRTGRQRLKLETEASYRYERQADVGIMLAAAARTCRLIEEMGAGKPHARCTERFPRPDGAANREISLRVKQANRVMGTQLAADDIGALLGRLQLSAVGSSESLTVSVPSLRRDLIEEIDIIEEAARVYGYANIGREETIRSSIFSNITSEDRRNEGLIDYLAARGFAEIVTSSFMDPGDPARMGWGSRDERSSPLRIANPLTEPQSTLRTSLLPGLLGVARRNTPAEQEEIRIFEVGKVFIPAAGGAGLPREDLHIAALFARQATPLQWLEKQRQNDYFDMKGEIEGLFERAGLGSGVSVTRPSDRGWPIVQWILKGAVIAEGGMVPKRVSEAFDVDSPLCYFDVFVDRLPAPDLNWPMFRPMSPYPAVKRDLCIVVGEKTSFEEVRNCLIRHAQYLDSIRLFDYYRGGHLGEGKRSFTFRLSFRSPDATLDSIAVDREVRQILIALQKELQATLRKD